MKKTCLTVLLGVSLMFLTGQSGGTKGELMQGQTLELVATSIAPPLWSYVLRNRTLSVEANSAVIEHKLGAPVERFDAPEGWMVLANNETNITFITTDKARMVKPGAELGGFAIYSYSSKNSKEGTFGVTGTNVSTSAPAAATGSITVPAN
jgi:hypothetical protein